MDDYANVVQIDELNLDRECIRLPSDYLKFANKYTEAKRELEEAKNRLKVTEADIAKQVRDTPGKFGLEKATEGAIKEAVLTHKDYRNAVADVNDRSYDADMVGNVVSALEHKKRSVTLLVELHGLGYFAEPKISERGRNAVDTMSKRATRRPLRVSREDL
jgi:hypothetical protein